MRKVLFLLAAFITAVFISCDNDSKYFNDDDTQKHVINAKALRYNPDQPIINGDSFSGNSISFLYDHPTLYSGYWNIYLQYQSGSDWKYYNPLSGGNDYPYSVYSGYNHHNYTMFIDGKYLPKGNPTVRIRISQYEPTQIGSVWSEPYRLKSNNSVGFIPPPNFTGSGSATITLEGFLNPPISNAHSVELTIGVSGIFSGSPAKNKYNKGLGFFSVSIGVEQGLYYTISYTAKYRDYSGSVLSHTDTNSRTVYASSGNNYVNFR